MPDLYPMSPWQYTLAIANAPGAIAVIELHGDVTSALDDITANALTNSWPVGSMRLTRSIGEIDDAMIARPSEHLALVMPHGGPRVVQRLLGHFRSLGGQPLPHDAIDPSSRYPEAADQHEALMLDALARTVSPLAVDLLLDQPRRWRTHTAGGSELSITDEDRARSHRLNRLLGHPSGPPVVVLAGPANVGKSTLSNALLGRSMSIAVDLPGTTRDYVAGRIELAGLVVQWYDTPGLRETDDPNERRAIELASSLFRSADYLIAMTDHASPWPVLPRRPDLRIMGKCDLQRGTTESTPQGAAASEPTSDPLSGGAEATEDSPVLCVSSVTGEGISDLVRTVRDHLVPPADLAHSGLWIFDDRLA